MPLIVKIILAIGNEGHVATRSATWHLEGDADHLAGGLTAVMNKLAAATPAASTEPAAPDEPDSTKFAHDVARARRAAPRAGISEEDLTESLAQRHPHRVADVLEWIVNLKKTTSVRSPRALFWKMVAHD